jgi:hypothetical protein
MRDEGLDVLNAFGIGLVKGLGPLNVIYDILLEGYGAGYRVMCGESGAFEACRTFSKNCVW